MADDILDLSMIAPEFRGNLPNSRGFRPGCMRCGGIGYVGRA
ncbi:hypothetical protein LCGC14_2975580, partial [marine sediment metagenome]